MKEKIKKIFKNRIFIFVLGILLSGSVSVLAVTYFPSNDVTYDNSASGLSSTNVQGAIDELYKTCTEKSPASETITDLLPSNPDELYKDEHGDIRYYGASPNNYVSFNNELWRIIGVIDGKIKIIRTNSIGDKAWANNSVNNWNNASLKSYLNGDYYNSIDLTYRNMISEETYYLGGPTSDYYTGSLKTLTAGGHYDIERSDTVYSGNPATTTQYIGLMYPSDYGYAAGSSCLSTALYKYDSSCKNKDWLFMKYSMEWFQTPVSDTKSDAVIIRENGSINDRDVSALLWPEIRPVLYLTSETQIVEGDGSQNNAFKLLITG